MTASAWRRALLWSLSLSMASSLIDGRWDYGDSDAAIFASIAVGIPEDGMPGFGAVMDAAQIDALVRLMREAERAQSH